MSGLDSMKCYFGAAVAATAVDFETAAIVSAVVAAAGEADAVVTSIDIVQDSYS